VAEAAGEGADLLVFPEYGAMELASLAGREAAADHRGLPRAVSDRTSPRPTRLHRTLAHGGTGCISSRAAAGL
jgi:predicted amidohydrolase